MNLDLNLNQLKVKLHWKKLTLLFSLTPHPIHPSRPGHLKLLIPRISLCHQEHGTAEFVQNTLLSEDSRITVIEGAKKNLPDETAQFAASKIKGIAEGAGEGDLLLVLISGGGSALLPLPAHGITLEEKLTTVKALAKSGATITELNTVRKNLSGLKGGKLAQAAYPAKVQCYCLHVGDVRPCQKLPLRSVHSLLTQSSWAAV